MASSAYAFVEKAEERRSGPSVARLRNMARLRKGFKARFMEKLLTRDVLPQSSVRCRWLPRGAPVYPHRTPESKAADRSVRATRDTTCFTSLVKPHTTKYLVPGRCTTIADVL